MASLGGWVLCTVHVYIHVYIHVLLVYMYTCTYTTTSATARVVPGVILVYVQQWRSEATHNRPMCSSEVSDRADPEDRLVRWLWYYFIHVYYYLLKK